MLAALPVLLIVLGFPHAIEGMHSYVGALLIVFWIWYAFWLCLAIAVGDFLVAIFPVPHAPKAKIVTRIGMWLVVTGLLFDRTFLMGAVVALLGKLGVLDPLMRMLR